MTEYAGKNITEAKGTEQVFGYREFVSHEGRLLSCGELVKYGNRCYAVIGRDVYATAFSDHPNGRGWVVNI